MVTFVTLFVKQDLLKNVTLIFFVSFLSCFPWLLFLLIIKKDTILAAIFQFSFRFCQGGWRDGFEIISFMGQMPIILLRQRTARILLSLSLTKLFFLLFLVGKFFWCKVWMTCYTLICWRVFVGVCCMCESTVGDGKESNQQHLGLKLSAMWTAVPHSYWLFLTLCLRWYNALITLWVNWSVTKWITIRKCGKSVR